MQRQPALAETAPTSRPLYVQVKELMMRRIIEGAWTPGMALPSEFQLADELGVSQGTVRKALDELSGENIVVRRQGRGTFVSAHDPHDSLFHFFHLVDADGARPQLESRLVSCRRVKASRDESERLNIAAGEMVLRIARVRVLDGTPAVYERICLPAALFPGLGQDVEIPNELYSLYQGRYGVTVSRAIEHLRAAAADPTEAKAIGVEKGTPLLEIERLAVSLDGRPIEWRVSRCDTRRHRYLSEVV